MASRAYLNNKIANTLWRLERDYCYCNILSITECSIHKEITNLWNWMRMKDRPNRRMRKRWDEKVQTK